MARQQRERRQQAARRNIQRDDRRTRQQTRKRFRRWFYLGSSGIIAVLIIIALFLPSFQGTTRQGSSRQALEIIPEGTDYFNYATRPPTYGPQWPAGAEWGIYCEEIRDERQVRNLAEGGVLIQYNTEDEDLINQLTQFAAGQPDFPCHLIIAPYAAMESTIAVTAWGALEVTDEYDEKGLQQFVDSYRGRGPQTAQCP